MISIPSSNEDNTLQQNTVAIPDPRESMSPVSSGNINKAFQTALIDTAVNPNTDGDLMAKTELNQSLYEQGMGKSVETQAIEQAKADTLNQWGSLLGNLSNDSPTDPEAQSNLKDALVNDAYVQQQIDESYNNDPNILAKEAATHLTNLKAADPELDPYLTFGKEHSTLIKEVEDNVKKSLMMDNMISDIEAQDENQGTIHWFIDRASQFLASPLNTLAWMRASNNLDDGINLKFLHKTETLLKMRRELDQMPIAEYEKRLPEFVDKVKQVSAVFGTNEARVLDTLKGIKSEAATNSNLTATDFWNGLDIIPGLYGLTKGALSVPKMLAQAGAKSTLSGAVANAAIKGSKNALVTDNTVSNIITASGFMKHNIPIGTSALTDKFLQQTEEVRRVLSQIPTGESNSADELSKAVDDTVTAIEDRYKSYGIIETNLTNTNYNVGTEFPKVELTVGKKDGKGWSTKQSAINNSKKLGFNENQLVQDKTTGEWFLSVKHDVDYLNRNVKPLEQIDSWYRNYLGSFSDFFSSNAVKLDKFLMGTASVNRSATESLTKAIEPLTNNLKSLNKAEKFRIKELAVKSLDNEKWFTYKELKKLGYNDKEIVGYNTYKELNDISYFMANQAIYKDLRFKGYKDITVSVDGWKTPELSGLDILSTDSIRPDIKRIWFVDKGKFLDGGTDELKKMVESGNYKLIKFSDAILTPNQEPVQFVLSASKNVSIKDLSPIQLEYLPGGRRSYAGKLFVKQADKGVYKDTGQTYIRGAFTHAVEQSPAKAREFVQKWNEALKNYTKIVDGKVKGKAATELKKTIEEATGLSFTQISKKINEGKLSLEPMEVVYDRDIPSFLRTENRGFAGPGADVDEGFRQYFSNYGIQGTLQARYKGFTKQRGGLLHDAEGNPAVVLDPFEATDKAVTNSIRYGMWNTWRQRAVQQWVDTATKSKLYSSTDSLSHEMASFDRLVPVKTTNPAEVTRIRDLEAQREAVKRILNYKLPEQVWWESGVRRLAQSTFGEKIGLSGLDVNHSDPFVAVRSVAFHAKLGLFNTTQFLLQAAHLPVLFSLNPVHFIEGMVANIPMSHIAMLRRPDIIKEYGKMAKVMGFKDAAEWEDFANMFLNSGWHDIGGTTQYLDNLGMGSLGIGKGSINKFLDYGRKPFDWGEQISRRQAYYIAYKNVKDANPKLKITSPEGRRLVMSEANRLSFNMNSEFAGRLNKGFLSIPMQFKTYMFRYLEALAGKQFTAQEKARLLAGSFTLYGMNALPGGKEGLDWIEKNYGNQLSPEGLKFLRNGFTDGLLFLGTDGEINTDFSRRVGLGASLTQEYRKIFNPDTQSVFDFFTGPVGSTLVSPLAESLWLTSVYARAEQGGFGHLLYKDLSPKLLSNISTWNTGMKAWYAWNYQMALSNKTLAPVGPVNKYQSIFTMLGLPPAIEGEFGDAIYQLKQNKEYIDNAAQVVLRLRRDTAMNPSAENFADNATAIAQFLSAFPDNVKLQIIQKANSIGDKQDGMVGVIEGMQKIQPNGPYTNMEYINKALQLDKLYEQEGNR